MMESDVKITDCGRNIIMCVFTACIPCSCVCIQGINTKRTSTLKHAVMNTVCLGMCFMCIGYAINRNHLFKRLNIRSEFKMDLLFSILCPVLTITQEYLISLRFIGADETTLLCEDPNAINHHPQNRH